MERIRRRKVRGENQRRKMVAAVIEEMHVEGEAGVAVDKV